MTAPPIPAPETTRRSRRGIVPWFLIAVGAMIAALWAVLLATGQVPEVERGDPGIWFHVAAELGAAGLAVTAGLAILRSRRVGWPLAGLALGALLYTTVNSAGYYADLGDWAAVAGFGVLTVVTGAVAARWLRS